MRRASSSARTRGSSPPDRQLGLGFSVEEMTWVPESDWIAPDLSSLPEKLEGMIGLDVETCDYGLQEKRGAGWAWDGGGHVVGYAVSADNFSGYLPVAHAGGGNVDHGQVRRWLGHVLLDGRQEKIFAHAMYDLGWMAREGVRVHGPVIDVQWVEALLDENRLSYSLDAIARDRTGRGKDERLLREAAAAYGWHSDEEVKQNLWRLPARYVGPYGAEDAALAREAWEAQRPELERQGLSALCELEHSLMPLYLGMRMRGVRIDADRAERLAARLEAEARAEVEELGRRAGRRVDVWSARSIARAMDAEGIRYGTTRTGQPSITKGLLEKTDHWLARGVLRAREREKLVGTFLRGQLLGQLRAGRVHGQIHPLKGDEGGTVTGRLSMSDPNLQFIPARTDEGREIRALFLPEEGEEFASLDFSQQEPRLLVHFAHLCGCRGAAEARERYLTDPSMNYHEFVAELTELAYKPAKILNLAIIYGRGADAVAADLGTTREEVRELFVRHGEEIPFAGEMSSICQRLVQRRGYIKSLLGRRSRFELWEPARWDDRDGRMLPLEQARGAWPNRRLVRARAHKALNSLIQPSAADQTKAAMRAVMEAGHGGRVLVQVHDELCCSVRDREQAREIAGVMEGAVRLEVPSRVGVATGPNWRDAA